MAFVRYSQQSAVNFLNSFNQSIFVMEECCVSFAVGAGYYLDELRRQRVNKICLLKRDVLTHKRAS
jgi:hypothetical protein